MLDKQKDTPYNIVIILERYFKDMKANKKDIEWLLDNATQYKISKTTGMPPSNVFNLKHKKAKIENLTLRTASALTELSKKLQEKNNDN